MSIARNPTVDNSLTQDQDQTTSPVHQFSRNPPRPRNRDGATHGESRANDMQQETYISSTRMIAVSLWVLTAATLLAAWTVYIAEYEGVAYMLALSAGVLAPAAGVAHIKVYSMKVTNLIRVTSGLQRASGPSEETVLHRVH